MGAGESVASAYAAEITAELNRPIDCSDVNTPRGETALAEVARLRAQIANLASNHGFAPIPATPSSIPASPSPTPARDGAKAFLAQQVADGAARALEKAKRRRTRKAKAKAAVLEDARALGESPDAEELAAAEAELAAAHEACAAAEATHARAAEHHASFDGLGATGAHRRPTSPLAEKRGAERDAAALALAMDRELAAQVAAARLGPGGAEAAVSRWGPAEVGLFVARHRDLGAVRAALAPGALARVGGAELLALTVADLVAPQFGLGHDAALALLRAVFDLTLCRAYLRGTCPGHAGACPRGLTHPIGRQLTHVWLDEATTGASKRAPRASNNAAGNQEQSATVIATTFRGTKAHAEFKKGMAAKKAIADGEAGHGARRDAARAFLADAAAQALRDAEAAVRASVVEARAADDGESKDDKAEREAREVAARDQLKKAQKMAASEREHEEQAHGPPSPTFSAGGDDVVAKQKSRVTYAVAGDALHEKLPGEIDGRVLYHEFMERQQSLDGHEQELGIIAESDGDARDTLHLKSTQKNRDADGDTHAAAQARHRALRAERLAVEDRLRRRLRHRFHTTPMAGSPPPAGRPAATAATATPTATATAPGPRSPAQKKKAATAKAGPSPPTALSHQERRRRRRAAKERASRQARRRKEKDRSDYNPTPPGINVRVDVEVDMAYLFEAGNFKPKGFDGFASEHEAATMLSRVFEGAAEVNRLKERIVFVMGFGIVTDVTATVEMPKASTEEPKKPKPKPRGGGFRKKTEETEEERLRRHKVKKLAIPPVVKVQVVFKHFNGNYRDLVDNAHGIVVHTIPGCETQFVKLSRFRPAKAEDSVGWAVRVLVPPPGAAAMALEIAAKEAEVLAKMENRLADGASDATVAAAMRPVSPEAGGVKSIFGGVAIEKDGRVVKARGQLLEVRFRERGHFDHLYTEFTTILYFGDRIKEWVRPGDKEGDGWSINGSEDEFSDDD